MYVESHYYAASLVGAWSSHTRRSVLQTVPIVKPIIDERKAKMEEYGEEWTHKPVSCSDLESLHYLWVALENVAHVHV